MNWLAAPVHSRPLGINLTKSPSTSVGARVVEWGREGLDGRPRPVPCAHLLGNAITPSPPSFTRVGFFHKVAAGAVWVSGGNAPFLAPSDSLSIADGEGWGEAAPPASLLVRPKNLPLSTGVV